jgi:lysophospholipase L1-like esterase
MSPEVSSVLRKILIRVAVLTLALVVGLCVLELAARVVFDRNGMHYGIEMWKYAKHLKRKSNNPEMSHEHVPGSEAVLMGVTMTINSQGLRDREFSLQKEPGTYRIMILGDSMTVGWGAPVEATYPKVLEQRIADSRSRASVPRVEVINTGVGNYNTCQELAYFRDRGLKYEPDMLVLGFYINDAEPTPKPSGGFLSRHSYLYVVASSFLDGLNRMAAQKESFADYYRGLYQPEQPGWQACRKALLELHRLCSDNGIKFRVLLIPELHSPAENYPFEEVHTLIKDIGREHGFGVIEVRQAMEGVDPPRLWVSAGDAHPSALAHRIIADELFDALSADFPWNTSRRQSQAAAANQ